MLSCLLLSFLLVCIDAPGGPFLGFWLHVRPKTRPEYALCEHADPAMAVVQYKKQELELAQDLYARAYDIQASLSGTNDPYIVAILTNIAGLLRTLGRHDDAEVVYQTVCTSRPVFGKPYAVVVEAPKHVASDRIGL